MGIIRKSEQERCHRVGEDREVRTIFSEAVPSYDWLTVTHSKTCPDRASASVAAPSHPNAVELILFLQSGTLTVAEIEYRFQPCDAAVLDAGEVHSASHLRQHDCLCLLLGRGVARKEGPWQGAVAERKMIGRRIRRGVRRIIETTAFAVTLVTVRLVFTLVCVLPLYLLAPLTMAFFSWIGPPSW